MWNQKKKKKTKLIDTENRSVVSSGRVWEGWKMDEGGQKVQTSSYKINRCWGCEVQHGDYS